MDPDPVLPLIIQRHEDIGGSGSAYHQEEDQLPNARSEQAMERPSSKYSDQKDKNKEDETRKEGETPGEEMPAEETTEKEKEDGMGDNDKKFLDYISLYKHIINGDRQNTKIFLDEHPEAKTCSITGFRETALHVAVKARVGKEFVQYLVSLLPNEYQFEKVNFERRTALHYAAMVGNTEAAKILVNKNPNLTQSLDGENATPLHLAAKFAHEETARYLLIKTMEIAKVAKLRPTQPHSTTPGRDPFEGEVGAKLLNSLILADYYDLAIIVVKNYKDLGYERDRDGVSALEKLAQNPQAFSSGSDLGFYERICYNFIPVEKINVTQSRRDVENPDASSPEYIIELPINIECVKRIYMTKLMNKQAEELSHMLCVAAAESKNIEIMAGAFSIASRTGISEMVSEIITAFPDILAFSDNKHRFMSHIAVENRKEKVYNLIHEMELPKNMLLSATDNDKNSVLHLAAKLGPTSCSGAVLQLQRELQWYQEVKKVVQPLYITMPNSDNQTPKQLFTKEHEKLVEKAEDWMKKTAQACSTVSSLITTVTFAGAITLPGGNRDEGPPVYLHDLSFLIFSISNALALFASATAVLMFMSILACRYSEEDFLKMLPTKMIIGLSSLFLSIVFMLPAFCSALHIALVHRLEWIVFPLIMLSLVPVGCYAFSPGPLLFEMLCSTYGPTIFKRDRKEKIC